MTEAGAMRGKAAPAGQGPSGYTLRQQVIFWIAAFALFVAFLWLLSDVLLPFVAGMVLAYLLNPLVGRIQRLGVNRQLAAVALVLVVIAVLVLLAMLIVPALGDQLAMLIERIPGYVARLQEWLADSNRAWLRRAVGERLPEVQKSAGAIAGQAAAIATAFLASVWTGGKALFSVISLIVITPVVAFYLLFDWEKMVAAIDSWIPRQHHATVRQLASQIDNAVSGFIRGQALCCVILGLFYALALILMGLNFGLLIGVIAAFLSFIPYVGTIVGLLLAGGVAIAQFWPEWIYFVIVLGIFGFGQFMEGNVLQPYFVGKTIGLPPVWLMFSLLAFGYLFGFVGLLVAVPVAAAIGVLTRFALRQYLKSPLYTGEKAG